MLSRLLPKPSHLRLLPLLSAKFQPYPSFPQPPPVSPLRFLSTNQNNNNNKDQSFSDSWKFSQESDGKIGNVFSDESGNTASGEEDGGTGRKSGEEDWLVREEDKAWSFEEEEEDDSVFTLKEGVPEFGETGGESSIALSGEAVEEQEKLEEEEKQLTAVLKGPNRAFGDLIAASGITDAMLDSLIALKDLEGVDGLPPLSVIEDMRYQKNTRKSTRAEIERQKLEEIAKARVRQVDDKGRAYGTGRRKCSIARVWVQPGDGKFIINDKQFDVYFPMLDHRATLLRPFSETKTLGLWDINCTVKGGGVSGQVGAIRLGISRALQNFEPELRPPLRAAGFLTRDPRVVERKKPGKAKARKSFQWVKR
ncbi:28S ribosomal protein S9, mitochondrial [Durio zibethinus]|uniref:28S ribosomal protein S9, mitochondrial n=1 Tax=Durio zibethinus TaxID=66656 RepID=A0A6P5YQK4_DURZI|nr:28S ribosomal protein S9, mitochondrial [Durio zibethinus]